MSPVAKAAGVPTEQATGDPDGTAMWLILIAPTLLLYSQPSSDMSGKPMSLTIFLCGYFLFLLHGVSIGP